MSAALTTPPAATASPPRAGASIEAHPAFRVAASRLAHATGRNDAVITAITFWKPQTVIANPQRWDERQANRGDVSLTVTHHFPHAPQEHLVFVVNVDVAALTVPLWQMLNGYAATP